jgi:hypothetical protein
MDNMVDQQDVKDQKFIFLPIGRYQFKFKATDQGSFDFKIRQFDTDQTISNQIYKDIALTPETSGFIVVDQTTHENSPLIIDENNDGNEDKVYYPSQFQGQTIDTESPITKVRLTGEKGLNDWYKNDVTVTLEANDNTNGSGIAKTEYSLDGGVTIQQYKEPFTLTSEGKINLRIKSTDNVGNEEPVQDIEIKIDKSAPEAKIIFNLSTQDFDFIGLDNLGKTTKNDTGQTITITDEAGNTTKLTLTSKDRPRRENISLKTIQYNNQKAIKIDSNLIGIFYTLNKNNQITFMIQRAVIEGEERLYTFYNPFNDTSEILIKKPKSKITNEIKNGKILLFLQTNKGKLDSNFK